jgi:hypothetical protein
MRKGHLGVELAPELTQWLGKNVNFEPPKNGREWDPPLERAFVI